MIPSRVWVAGLALLAGSGCERTQSAPSPTALLELRLVCPGARPDCERHDYRADSVVFLEREALLSDSDLLDVRPSMAASGDLVLAVRFPPEAGERLSARLRDNLGGHLAVVIESRVRDVVLIASPVGAHGQLTINSGLAGAEAERLRTRFLGKWPRR